jgi:hypothetical protein
MAAKWRNKFLVGSSKNIKARGQHGLFVYRIGDTDFI